MAQKSYDSVNKSLQKSYAEVAQASQKKAAKETREKLGENNLEDITNCNVSVDGTWQKRGFSSSNGIVTLMSSENGKCLDYHVLSKKCKGCQHWEGKEESEGYEQWKSDHDCSINHKASSGAMEVAGAVKMFSRSVDYLKLRYTG